MKNHDFSKDFDTNGWGPCVLLRRVVRRHVPRVLVAVRAGGAGRRPTGNLPRGGRVPGAAHLRGDARGVAHALRGGVAVVDVVAVGRHLGAAAQVEVRLQGPPLGRQAGLYVPARRPRTASPMCTRCSHVLPPQLPGKTHMFAPAPHAPRRRRTRMARSGAALTGTCFPEQQRLAV